jgi:hypothetical protein
MRRELYKKSWAIQGEPGYIKRAGLWITYRGIVTGIYNYIIRLIYK